MYGSLFILVCVLCSCVQKPDIQYVYVVASAPAVTGSVFMQTFVLFSGQCGVSVFVYDISEIWKHLLVSCVACNNLELGN